MSGFLQCSGDDLEFGTAGDRGISQLPASLSALFGAQITQTFFDTPTGAIVQLVQNQRARSAIGGTPKRNRPITTNKVWLTVEQANERGKVVGIVFDGATTEDYVELRIVREQARLFRQAILQRPENALTGTAFEVAAELMATIEPANLAMTFVAWPARMGRVFEEAFGSIASRAVRAGLNSMLEFAATESLVELRNQVEDRGRSVEQFVIDMLTSAGLDTFFEGLFAAYEAGELDDILDGQKRPRPAKPDRNTDGDRVREGIKDVAKSAAENGIERLLEGAQPFSATPAPVFDVDTVIRQATSYTRTLQHMSVEQRAELLGRTSAALLSARLPQHDGILLLMRLLDQDNEINRRPPNSGFAGPIQ